MGTHRDPPHPLLASGPLPKELTHESTPPPRGRLKMPMTLGFHSACPHESLQDFLLQDTQMQKGCAHG